MSKEKKGKVIHVDKLVIHAKNVEVIREQRPHREREVHERDPWGFLWGRPRPRADEQTKAEEAHDDALKDD